MSKPSLAELDVVKKAYLKTDWTETKLFELLSCQDQPLYFMEHFMRIQHPTRGALPFHPYDYQRRMIAAMENNRFSILMTSRQAGKTTCAAGFLLWKAMFIPDSTILIVANKFSQALEVMERVRYTYENLPNHIRAGVTEYNKSSISFDNGSRIVSRATSADAGRGLAVSLLYCDEFAFVPPNKQKEFWTSIQPTLAEGGACIITSTPKNDEDIFAQLWKGAEDNIDEFGNVIESGVGKNGFFAVKVSWWEHPDRDEEWARPFRESLGPARFRQEFECVSGDTLITLRSPSGIENVTIKEVYERCSAFTRYGSLALGKLFYPNDIGYEVLTPSGWQSFSGIGSMGENKTCIVSFDDDTSIECSLHHGFITDEGAIVQAASLTVGQKLLQEGGSVSVASIRGTGCQATYSLIEVEGGHQYYTNRIASANCDFVSDDETLINPLTLSRLVPSRPLSYTGTVRWYHDPQPNRGFLVALDPAMGTERNFGAIEVFQMPEMIQVAEWQSNTLAPRHQVRVMMEILCEVEAMLLENPEQINNPEIYWTFENNALGEGPLTIIEDTGEDRFPGMLVTERRRKGVQMRRVRRGLHTTSRNKLAACARLKSLIESDRMVIHSNNLLKQLKVFVSTGATFQAKPGEFDDLVSATLMVIRMLDVTLSWGTDAGDLREFIADDEISGEPMPVIV